MRIVGLLGTKKVSKRLPNKAILDFGGKPMFQWNVEKGLTLFDKMYVTSDDDNILKASEKLGAIPIKRNDLALMICPNIEYYIHSLQFMDNPDVIVAIQVNSPTVDLEIIERVKNMMEIGFKEVKTCHPDKKDYGSVWGLTVDKIKNYPNPYCSQPEAWIVDKSIDIHFKEDLPSALVQLKKR